MWSHGRSLLVAQRRHILSSVKLTKELFSSVSVSHSKRFRRRVPIQFLVHNLYSSGSVQPALSQDGLYFTLYCTLYLQRHDIQSITRSSLHVSPLYSVSASFIFCISISISPSRYLLTHAPPPVFILTLCLCRQLANPKAGRRQSPPYSRLATLRVRNTILTSKVSQTNLHCVSNKVPTLKLSVTLSNLNRFSKFLHCWKAYEICYKTYTTSPTSPQACCALPWEIKNSNFLQIFSDNTRYGKMPTNCAYFNSSTRVTAYIYVFLLKSCTRR